MVRVSQSLVSPVEARANGLDFWGCVFGDPDRAMPEGDCERTDEVEGYEYVLEDPGITGAKAPAGNGDIDIEGPRSDRNGSECHLSVKRGEVEVDEKADTVLAPVGWRPSWDPVDGRELVLKLEVDGEGLCLGL